MICQIAELYFDIPEAGGLSPRCREYLCAGTAEGSWVLPIKEDLYIKEDWAGCSDELICYMESGHQFHMHLLNYNGMMLHSSAIQWQGRGYLFSGASGMGKSTHTRLWQQLYGEDAQVFNDDKPALRLLDGCWYAYGTPWCGKDGINQNKKVPLAGICFLQRGSENRICRLSAAEALPYVTSQTTWRLYSAEKMGKLLDSIDSLVRKIPIFLLECTPTVEAAKLSSETMSRAADAAGL